MSNFLMIVKNNPTPYNWYTKRFGNYKILIIRPGKTFKTIGIEVSPDHKKITLRPSESHEGFCNLWQHCGENRVICHSPEKEIQIDLSTVSSVSVRAADGEFLHYDFRPAKISDLLICILFEIGFYVKPKQ